MNAGRRRAGRSLVMTLRLFNRTVGSAAGRDQGRPRRRSGGWASKGSHFSILAIVAPRAWRHRKSRSGLPLGDAGFRGLAGRRRFFGHAWPAGVQASGPDAASRSPGGLAAWSRSHGRRVAGMAETVVGRVSRWRALKAFGGIERGFRAERHLTAARNRCVPGEPGSNGETTWGGRLEMRSGSGCDLDRGPDAVEARPSLCTGTSRVGRLPHFAAKYSNFL